MLGRAIGLVTRVVPRPWLHRVAVAMGYCIAQCMRGGKYIDPVDGFRYSALLPYGRLERRLNALAPKSLSLERHRLIWLYLERQGLLEREGVRVLHMAPEWCLQKRLKGMRGVRYTSADLESPWAEIHCDIQALPFGENEFDCILCNHVLEHIPDDGLAMRELYRVLAPGGFAMLLVPLDMARSETLEDASINTDSLREQYYGQRDHLRLYGQDYARRLEQAGFAVEWLETLSWLGEEDVARYALGNESVLVIGRKG